MMGAIIVGLIEFVKKKRGSDGVDRLLEGFVLSPSMIQPERVYSDVDFQKMLDGAAAATGLSREELEAEWARFMVRFLREHFAGFFKSSRTARDLLMKVPEIHFEEFPTLANSQERKLTITESSEGHIVYSYTSENRLCTFMKALIGEILRAYGQKGTVEEVQCMKEGAGSCVVRVELG